MMFDVLLTIIGTVLLIILAPIILGIGIALLIGAIGGLYYFTVISISIIIWIIIGIIWWQ